ncbi:MAG: UDP-galactopyranose mutase [Tannerellaceae bacterium]|nr:UDP-galactopyranose mutase [Tannerellaceae bacterium]
MLNRYDLLLVGSGLFNSIIAREAKHKGLKCLVLEKRDNIGGNLYCEDVEGIHVHKYGPHIFHTKEKRIWDYVNNLTSFNHFIYTPLARYKDKLYNLPFNMNTFYQLWGTITPAEAMIKLKEQQIEMKNDNLEEKALSLVGKDIYETLIKGYTEKQWGKSATELPSFIIQRLPIRFRYDNNYFNDPYQGIPVGGYNPLIEQCFKGCDIQLSTDFLHDRDYFAKQADKVVFTGMIDAYYEYIYGALEYRSLRFEEERLETENYQGNAAVNYTQREIPYTRIIEHKLFEFGTQPHTVITREYPAVWEKGQEPFYPVNTAINNKRYEQYRLLSEKEKKVIFGGRLGYYKYLDMDQIIALALDASKEIINCFN